MEACSEHGDPVGELHWLLELEPGQPTGTFWCHEGRHYVEVRRDEILSEMAAA